MGKLVIEINVRQVFRKSIEKLKLNSEQRSKSAKSRGSVA